MKIRIGDEDFDLSILSYDAGRKPALVLTCATGEPYGTVTTNADEKLDEGEIVIKDYDSGPKFKMALVAAGVIEDTGRKVGMGYATGSVCKLLWKGD